MQKLAVFLAAALTLNFTTGCSAEWQTKTLQETKVVYKVSKTTVSSFLGEDKLVLEVSTKRHDIIAILGEHGRTTFQPKQERCFEDNKGKVSCIKTQTIDVQFDSEPTFQCTATLIYDPWGLMFYYPGLFEEMLKYNKMFIGVITTPHPSSVSEKQLVEFNISKFKKALNWVTTK